ncbi:MAG: efflux RND transporter periplasmic adaptor subunit [Vicinamibacterales bacterium]
MTDLKDDLAALRIERDSRPAGSRRWVGWVVALVLLAAVAAGGWAFLTRERPIEVQVATVTQRSAGTQAAVLNASGYVTARRRATVSSKITGKVVEVNVEEGMAVREGQVLARLDDATYRASLALAEAQVEAARRQLAENEVRLSEAKLTLGRNTRLLEDGFITAAEVDKAKADVDSLAARISALTQQVDVADRQVALERTNLDNTIIRAPFSGVAISKDAQPGEMVSPVSAGGGFTRTGICTIVDMRSLEIEVDVNEAYIGRVEEGQGVTAVLDAYPDWEIPASVITTVPTADRQKATVLVRIAFKGLDPRILPDMGVKVTFLREADATAAAAAQPVTLAPRTAIVERDGATVAFVVGPENVVERRAVRVGGADGDRVEILAGLQPGARVIVAPPVEVVDGVKVVTK